MFIISNNTFRSDRRRNDGRSSCFLKWRNSIFSRCSTLGCGRVSDTLRYYYIVKDDLGQKVESANSTDTHIVNTKDIPKIKTYETNFKNKKLVLIGINFKERTDYVLEVPENTIKYDYNIDLK